MSRTPFLDSLTTLVKNGTNIGHLYIFSSGHYADFWGTQNLTASGTVYLNRDSFYSDGTIFPSRLSATNTGLSGTELSYGCKVKRGTKNGSSTTTRIIGNGGTPSFNFMISNNTTTSLLKVLFNAASGSKQTTDLAGYNLLKNETKIIGAVYRDW